MTLGLPKLKVYTIRDTLEMENANGVFDTLAYWLVGKEVDTLGNSSLKTLSWLTSHHRWNRRQFATHWPRCNTEAPVYTLRNKLADK